jgi:hypothetical protein
LATERHTTAFVVGFVVGGLAGAAVTLWKTPWSGAQLRAMLAERAEEFLFRLTGMDESQSVDRVDGLAEAPVPPSPPPVPVEAPPAPPVAAGEAAALPATFRGEVLIEQPTDIVLDGPRPSLTER